MGRYDTHKQSCVESSLFLVVKGVLRPKACILLAGTMCKNLDSELDLPGVSPPYSRA